MKRKSLIAVLAAIMVMMCTAMSFAGTDLELRTSYPENGQKNTSIENLGVKLEFNNEVNSKAAKKVNKKAVKLIDADGKKVPIQVLFSDEDEGLVLVVLDTDKKYTVLNNSEYKLVISDKFVDNDGNTLKGGATVKFKTYNQKLNNWVNMLMMVVMFGGIMVVSMKQQNNQQEEAARETAKKSIDPYKEAKRTGKTVEEVKAEIAKKEEKAAKKRAKKGIAEPTEKHIDNCAELLNNVYHVHAPAPTNHEDRSIEAMNRMRRQKKAAAKAEKAEREAAAAKKRAKKK